MRICNLCAYLSRKKKTKGTTKEATIQAGKRTKKRGEEYESNPKKRSQARYKRKNGLISDMQMMNLNNWKSCVHRNNK